MKKTAPALLLLLLTLLALLQACTTSTTIDEYREDNNLPPDGEQTCKMYRAAGDAVDRGVPVGVIG